MPMKIDRVVVRWGETFNMGDYSNVSPAVELSATIAPGDEAGAVTDALMDAAQRFVREMVDQALELRGKPAHYSIEPRYDIWYMHLLSRRYLIIAPADSPPPIALSMYKSSPGHRLHAAQALAASAEPRDGITDIVLDGSQVAIADIYTYLLNLRSNDRSTKLHVDRTAFLDESDNDGDLDDDENEPEHSREGSED